MRFSYLNMIHCCLTSDIRLKIWKCVFPTLLQTMNDLFLHDALLKARHAHSYALFQWSIILCIAHCEAKKWDVQLSLDLCLQVFQKTTPSGPLIQSPILHNVKQNSPLNKTAVSFDTPVLLYGGTSNGIAVVYIQWQVKNMIFSLKYYHFITHWRVKTPIVHMYYGIQQPVKVQISTLQWIWKENWKYRIIDDRPGAHVGSINGRTELYEICATVPLDASTVREHGTLDSWAAWARYIWVHEFMTIHGCMRLFCTGGQGQKKPEDASKSEIVSM